MKIPGFTAQRTLLTVALFIFTGLNQSINAQYSPTPHPLVAKHYYSGFELAHDTYNAITAASDGMIYYVLSSKDVDRGGQVYVFDPSYEEIKHLGDLTKICGEAGSNAIPQGKSHTNFYKRGGKLYFSTHAGY